MLRLHNRRELPVVNDAVPRMTRACLILCLPLVLSCIASQPPKPFRAESLELTLRVNSGLDPIGRVTVNTEWAEPIAIGEALGFAGVYFDIELRDGIHDANTSNAELFQRPRSNCVRNTSPMSFDVPLRQLTRRFNGKEQNGDYRWRFLSPGRYEARIVYHSPPVPLKSTCASTTGTAASPWVQFTIPER